MVDWSEGGTFNRAEFAWIEACQDAKGTSNFYFATDISYSAQGRCFRSEGSTYKDLTKKVRSRQRPRRAASKILKRLPPTR